MDPQAFAVLVGDRWVASMSTRDYTVISLVAQVREDLPPSLEPVFPYRLVVPLFNAEWHVTAVNHEAFHVYQAQVAFDRFVESEAVRSFAGYPFDDAAFTVAWEEERDLLRRAVRAETDEEAARLARAFLERRAGRRAAANLSSSAVAYERRREWVEGTAKYVEYVLWRDAVRTGYQPVPEVRDLPDFKGYQRSFAQYGPEQRRLIGEGANREGDGRFYYSGLGQALLLDRFAPGWQEELLEEGAWLETLLDEALAE
jgi:hypothetical protein